jgi:hypothetical protein
MYNYIAINMPLYTTQLVTDPWLNVDLLNIRQHTSASKGHEIQHKLHSKRSPLSLFILYRLFGGKTLRRVDIET